MAMSSRYRAAVRSARLRAPRPGCDDCIAQRRTVGPFGGAMVTVEGDLDHKRPATHAGKPHN
jgi:hypothetical protein